MVEYYKLSIKHWEKASCPRNLCLNFLAKTAWIGSYYFSKNNGTNKTIFKN